MNKLIYYFFKKNDFSQNIICFILSEIICLAIDYFPFVYNGYIFCENSEVGEGYETYIKDYENENLSELELFEL